MAQDYQRPGWFTKHVFNPIVAALTRLGISVAGSRGHTQWTRNLRASGSGRLLVGRRGADLPFPSPEVGAQT